MKKSKVYEYLYRQERRHNKVLEIFVQKILDLNTSTAGTAEDTALTRPTAPAPEELSTLDAREIHPPPYGQSWQSEYV